MSILVPLGLLAILAATLAAAYMLGRLDGRAERRDSTLPPGTTDNGNG